MRHDTFDDGISNATPSTSFNYSFFFIYYFIKTLSFQKQYLQCEASAICSVSRHRVLACGGEIKNIAVVEDPAVIERLFTRIGLCAQPPSHAPGWSVSGGLIETRTGFGQGRRTRLGWCSCQSSDRRKWIANSGLLGGDFSGKRRG